MAKRESSETKHKRIFWNSLLKDPTKPLVVNLQDIFPNEFTSTFYLVNHPEVGLSVFNKDKNNLGDWVIVLKITGKTSLSVYLTPNCEISLSENALLINKNNSSSLIDGDVFNNVITFILNDLLIYQEMYQKAEQFLNTIHRNRYLRNNHYHAAVVDNGNGTLEHF